MTNAESSREFERPGKMGIEWEGLGVRHLEARTIYPFCLISGRVSNSGV